MSYAPNQKDIRTEAYLRCTEELGNGNFQVAQVFAILILEEAVRDLASRVTNAAGSITAAIGQTSRLQPTAAGPL